VRLARGGRDAESTYIAEITLLPLLLLLLLLLLPLPPPLLSAQSSHFIVTIEPVQRLTEGSMGDRINAFDQDHKIRAVLFVYIL